MIFDKESFNDAKKGAKTNSPLLKGRGPPKDVAQTGRFIEICK